MMYITFSMYVTPEGMNWENI